MISFVHRMFFQNLLWPIFYTASDRRYAHIFKHNTLKYVSRLDMRLNALAVSFKFRMHVEPSLLTSCSFSCTWNFVVGYYGLCLAETWIMPTVRLTRQNTANLLYATYTTLNVARWRLFCWCVVERFVLLHCAGKCWSVPEIAVTHSVVWYICNLKM